MPYTNQFATAINCIDGRAQTPVIRFVQGRIGVPYVDMITVRGAIRVLAENNDTARIEHLKRETKISHENHGSQHLFIVAHFDCYGNPVDEATQRKQMSAAIANAQVLFPGMRVTGIWVGEDLKPSEIK